jgi:hypothetical protein
MRSCSRFVALIALVLLTGFQAAAVPTTLASVVDLPFCDPLIVPADVEELGTIAGGFPVGEQIAVAHAAPGGPIAAVGPPGTNCTGATGGGAIDSPFMANHGIVITNLNAVDFVAVWYVVNPETIVSNLDGAINGFAALRIDAVGVSKPLISESLAADGIFNAGETWVFMLQDWTNSALELSTAINTVGIATIGDASSGSIIALVAPEPGTAGLLILGLLGMARFARKSA